MRSIVLAALRAWLPAQGPRPRTFAAGAALGTVLLVALALLGGSGQPATPVDGTAREHGAPQTARQPGPPIAAEAPDPAPPPAPTPAPTTSPRVVPLGVPPAGPAEPDPAPPTPETGPALPDLPEVAPELDELCESIFSIEDAAPEDTTQARQWLRELALRCEEFTTAMPDGTTATVTLRQLEPHWWWPRPPERAKPEREEPAPEPPTDPTDEAAALGVTITTEFGTVTGWLLLDGDHIRVCLPCALPE